jgi:hypothetical protein
VRHPFLRTLAGASAVATDPNFENVTLLLHGDGTNGGQNNTFVDGSTNNFTITRNGNTTQGTFSPYGDNWSNFFDGTDDYLSIADNANLRAGSGTFTIEAWIYRAATGAAHTIYAKGGASTGIVFQVTSGNVLRFTHTTTNIDSTGTIGLATWTHVAVVREGTGTNETKLYINGTQDGAGTVSTDFTQTEEVRIGTDRSAAADFNGYISNLRFVKGTSVYTGAFTVPTAPLIAISNTQLLTCKSNRFCDESANAFTITRNNNATVQRFSPFSPTAAYAAGTIGGSGYFDGTGDYLVTPTNAALSVGTGDFTCETFVYFNALEANNHGIVSQLTVGDGSNHSIVFFTLGSTVYLRVQNLIALAFEGTATVTVGQWYHFALVRSGTNIAAFVNGSRINSGTNSTNIVKQVFTVGRLYSSTDQEYSKVTVSDFRLVKGSAVYDPTQTTLTVPTSPITAVTNTSLLLNFTNAAILDNAMMAVPETVGNAQISTTVKKYGTGSLAFDGTGDWLRVQGTPNLFNLSTGDFTIECWFYAVSTGTSAIVQQGTTDWRISYTSSGVMRYEVGANSIQTSTGAFSFNTWTHLAICKSGATTTLYLNGTSRVTTTNSPTNSGNPVYVGANIDGGNPYWPLNGYIDDLRITKGVARYTANFTAPTAAFPDL